MAFVFRAERKLNQNTNEIFDNDPIEQSKTNNSIEYMQKKNDHPFGSSTSKEEGSCLINPNDNPGPGTYDRDEKNISYYNMLKKTQEQKKDLNLFTAVENNIIPQNLGKILKLNQKIAFNTRGLRFKNDVNNLNNDSPGPGSYNIKSTEDMILKNNRNKNKIKFNSFGTTGSMYRKTTIPGKENFGYDDIDEHIQIMIPDPNKEIKLSGEKNDKVGPGSYDLNLSWDKNVLKWQKNTSTNTNNINSSTNNTSLSISNNTNVINNKKKTLQKNPYKNLIKTYRNSHSKKNTNSIDFIFDNPPGPGYYTQEYYNNNYNIKSHLQCFDSTTPRFQQIKDNKFSNIGPGFYYNLNSPKIVSKPHYKKGHFLDYDKIKNKHLTSGIDAYLMKIDTKNDIGPGTYDVNKSWIRKKVSNLQNFGSQEKRFVYKDNEMPGPGYYINSDNNYNNNDEDFDNNNSSKNILNDNDSNNEILKKYQNEKFNVPGVGTYNPNIVLSINYKVKSNVNPFVNKKKVGFSSQEKRFENNDKKLGNNDNNILGPGLYYNEKPKLFKQNVVPFNQGKRRFSVKKDDFPLLGPGSYELSNLNDWNKKSHNILFI